LQKGCLSGRVWCDRTQLSLADPVSRYVPCRFDKAQALILMF
jgi:hypothetical protein